MSKQTWKPGNMLYPLPAVMVSVTDGEGKDNIITVAWAGTVCTNPPMVSISIRFTLFYDMIKNRGIVINLTTEKLAFATDYCGVRSGRDVDKFKEMKLTKEKAEFVSAPMIKESPVCIECKVREIKELGSHHMFLQTSSPFMWKRNLWTAIKIPFKRCAPSRIFPRRVSGNWKKRLERSDTV